MIESIAMFLFHKVYVREASELASPKLFHGQDRCPTGLHAGEMFRITKHVTLFMEQVFNCGGGSEVQEDAGVEYITASTTRVES